MARAWSPPTPGSRSCGSIRLLALPQLLQQAILQPQAQLSLRLRFRQPGLRPRVHPEGRIGELAPQREVDDQAVSSVNPPSRAFLASMPLVDPSKKRAVASRLRVASRPTHPFPSRSRSWERNVRPLSWPCDRPPRGPHSGSGTACSLYQSPYPRPFPGEPRSA